MNKKLYFSVCITILCSFFAVLSAVLLFHISDNKTIDSQAENKKPVPIKNIDVKNADAKNVKYYLVIYENGKINAYEVYENGVKMFYEELEKINVMTMRENDREMFKKGIAVSSKEDLICLVEDYTG